MCYEFHPEALAEYGKATAYYGEHGRTLADRFVDSVEDAIQRRKRGGLRMHCLLVVVFTTCTIIGADSEPTNATTHSRLPNVLIIGDSISIGYTPYVEAVLEGKAVVVHNEGNAAHSGNGLVKLDAWLGDTEWDVIHFNHGLHDLKYVDDSGKNVESKELGHIQVPLDQYEKNLDAIVTRLKQTRAKLIFATTTPFPDKPSGPLREVADCERYNAVALAVMKRHKIPVNDLYAFALPRLAELQRPNNVHFTDEGSEVLGGEVARRIESALATASRQTRPKHESIRGPGK